MGTLAPVTFAGRWPPARIDARMKRAIMAGLAAVVFSAAELGAAPSPIPSTTVPEATPATRSLPAQHPGDLVSVHSIPAPAGASAWKILYLTTGLNGQMRQVSGVVVAPSGRSTVPRNVVAWAHPTTGVWGSCAPSLRPTVLKTIPGLNDMLARGYVIAATDYPGLGTPGTHPYLVGISEARSVIDSVRAARNIPQTNSGARFAVWGHSQGGHAALFTGQLSARYAPELKLVGVAAAAPATELETLLRDDISRKVGQVLASYALWAWARVYHANLASAVNGRAEAHVKAIARICIQTDAEVALVGINSIFLGPHFLAENIYTTAPWNKIMEENEPDKAPVLAPVFISQGTGDEVVRPSVTASYVHLLCSRKENVTFLELSGVTHHLIAWDSKQQAVSWIANRFAGTPLPANCTAHAQQP